VAVPTLRHLIVRCSPCFHPRGGSKLRDKITHGVRSSGRP